MSGRLEKSLEECPVIDKNGYQYFIHPLTDGIPCIDPELLTEVADWMLEVGDFDCDLIVAPESMGIPLAVPISLSLHIPFTIVRKRVYGLENEVVFEKRTGYAGSTMSLNGIRPGDRVVIVDDVISTGGTLESLLKALDKAGAEVIDILIPINKGNGAETVLKDTGHKVKTMVDIEMASGRVRCLPH